jgi:rod shape determining protein RodA
MAINVGMVLGLLPTIGVPLPLMSYGGTALCAVLAGIGLIVNVRTRRFVN